MIDLSVGHLQKMIQTVQLLGRESAPFEEFQFRATSHILKEDSYLFEVLIELDIIMMHEVNDPSRIFINELFIEIIDFDWKIIGREIVWFYIIGNEPSWSINLHSGFEAFRKKIEGKINTKQLFRSLALLPQNTEITAEVADWWTRASNWSRAISQKKEQEAKKAIGNEGENLSRKYEETRTKYKPKWVSMDSDNYGYDIESIRDEGSDDIIYIEVKSTTRRVQSAHFFVSRNEGDVCAKNLESYFFHLWNIADAEPTLLVVPGTEVMAHFPENHGTGKWDVVKIPFTAFNWDGAIKL